MQTRSVAVLLALSLGAATFASAAEDPRYAAVAALGELNGVALQCKYLDQVRRMKAAVVAHAPKERSFGLAFDEATNKAFLAFARTAASCPAHAVFETAVGERIATMQEVFAAP
jgi:hypothetical protein